MTEVATPQIPISLSYKCFVNLRSFILIIVKQWFRVLTFKFHLNVHEKKESS